MTTQRVTTASVSSLSTASPTDQQSARESVETYSFELDDDLTKVVTVWRGASSCRVNVRYGGDYLLREENHTIALDGPVEIEEHPHGITLRTKRKGFPWWPRKVIRHF